METGLSNSMAALDVKKDDFLEWFWNETNRDRLIKQLNTYALSKKLPHRIRLEINSPVVYAIVVNNFPLAGEQQNGQVKLAKVGFTHVSIGKDTNNRMEQLQKKIENAIASAPDAKASEAKAPEVKAAILFAWRIGALDTRSFHDIEDDIRQKFGIPVKQAKTTGLNLPAPTEWVLTTQEHINLIITLKNSKQWEEMFDLFEGINAPAIPEEYQDWLQGLS